MNEMPDFEMLPPDPPSPKKPRRKPMKRRKKMAITTPKKRASMLQTIKKTRKKRRKVRVARKNAGFDKLDTNMSHKAFEAAWNILGMLSKFDAEAKIRILEKVKEVWT